jgi:hypothetical protein
MRARWLFSAAFSVGLLTCSWRAQAYCLTHGCSDRKQECVYDSNGCLQSGPLLHWASSCVSFDVQKDGSLLRGIDYDAAHRAVVSGFSQWLNADCGGVGPSIQISDYGPVECREAEYNQDAPNANVIMFRDDDWPYENAIDTLALTTLIFNADSGEIYDADVEVNTVQSPMATDNVGPNDIDFNSVMTHELGHFLGLSHSNAQGSTMHFSYAPGQTSMASIEFDDEQGVCAALPPDRSVSSTSCEPRHGFSSECALPETSCALSPGKPAGMTSGLVGLLGLSWLLRARRKKPRPSSRRL